MTIKPEVLAILSAWETLTIDHEPEGWPNVRMRELTTIRAELLEMDAEIDRLRNILDLLRTDRNGEKYHFAISRGGSLVRIDSAIDAMHNSAREAGE